jgi:hypothetical protein
METTALLFFSSKNIFFVGKVQRTLIAMVYVVVGDLATVVVEPQEVSRQ